MNGGSSARLADFRITVKFIFNGMAFINPSTLSFGYDIFNAMQHFSKAAYLSIGLYYKMSVHDIFFTL